MTYYIFITTPDSQFVQELTQSEYESYYTPAERTKLEKGRSIFKNKTDIHVNMNMIAAKVVEQTLNA